MVMTPDYRLVKQGGKTFCNIKYNKCLPICGEPLFMRSWRSRSLIDSDGEKSNLMIRRLMCSGCDRTPMSFRIA
jgi:hypothetical protein